MEPHPLWEYPCSARTQVEEIFSFDCAQFARQQQQQECQQTATQMQVAFKGSMNGVALWSSIDFDNFQLNTGLEEQIGEKLVWNRQYKQAVHLFDAPYSIENTAGEAPLFLNASASFQPKLGKFDLHFAY